VAPGLIWAWKPGINEIGSDVPKTVHFEPKFCRYRLKHNLMDITKLFDREETIV